MSETITSAFDALVSVTSGFGVEIVERTKLTFAPLVLASLAKRKTNEKVLIICSETPADALEKYNALTTEQKRDGSVLYFDAPYARVRPHVMSALKTRKVKHGTTNNLKHTTLEGENITYGFGIVKK